MAKIIKHKHFVLTIGHVIFNEYSSNWILISIQKMSFQVNYEWQKHSSCLDRAPTR